MPGSEHLFIRTHWTATSVSFYKHAPLVKIFEKFLLKQLKPFCENPISRLILSWYFEDLRIIGNNKTNTTWVTYIFITNN